MEINIVGETSVHSFCSDLSCVFPFNLYVKVLPFYRVQLRIIIIVIPNSFVQILGSITVYCRFKMMRFIVN